ncbi:MAG: hypothetical protein JJU19_06695 [Pararhodobacter sp.]|nr:hypothetical protein [Pararhodobacter sp.]
MNSLFRLLRSIMRIFGDARAVSRGKRPDRMMKRAARKAARRGIRGPRG